MATTDSRVNSPKGVNTQWVFVSYYDCMLIVGGYIKRNITTTTATTMWHFGPFAGHDLPCAGVSRRLRFNEVRISTSRPTPTLSLFGKSLKTCPVYMVVLPPALLFEFTNASKLPHPAKCVFDKVQKASRECAIYLQNLTEIC